MKNRVKVRRVEVGKKQKDLAILIGVTPQYLRLIELDKVDIRKSTMIKIAEALNSTVQELFFFNK